MCGCGCGCVCPDLFLLLLNFFFFPHCSPGILSRSAHSCLLHWCLILLLLQYHFSFPGSLFLPRYSHFQAFYAHTHTLSLTQTQLQLSKLLTHTSTSSSAIFEKSWGRFTLSSFLLSCIFILRHTLLNTHARLLTHTHLHHYPFTSLIQFTYWQTHTLSVTLKNATLAHLKKHTQTLTHARTHKRLPLLPANYVTMLIPRQRIKIALRLWMPVLMLRIVVAHTQVTF